MDDMIETDIDSSATSVIDEHEEYLKDNTYFVFIFIVSGDWSEYIYEFKLPTDDEKYCRTIIQNKHNYGKCGDKSKQDTVALSRKYKVISPGDKVDPAGELSEITVVFIS